MKNFVKNIPVFNYGLRKSFKDFVMVVREMLPDSFAVKAIALLITVKPANLVKKYFLRSKINLSQLFPGFQNEKWADISANLLSITCNRY